MNPNVKAVIGEADLASPTERAALQQGLQTGPAGTDDEGQEVKLAQQILAAVKSGDKNTVIQAASELIRMHHQPTAYSYAREHAKLNDHGGSHVQPVGGGQTLRRPEPELENDFGERTMRP